jgi:glycosyltransferase involved in cell wall biosynthesis
MTETEPEGKKVRSRPKVLLTYDHPQPFVMRDLEIFKKHFEMMSFEYHGKKSLPRLSTAVARTNLSFSWFVLGHATSTVMFSKTFGKKSIVNAGGWDVLDMPEIDYGAMRSRKRIQRTTLALENADKVTTVSESMKGDVLKWVDRDVEVIHLGFDWTYFVPKGEKERMALTVGNVSEQNLKRKGLEGFIRAAKYLPDVQFVLVGSLKGDVSKRLESMISPNVQVTGYVEDDELMRFFQRSKVYVQASYHEGFGCSMAEAMLCECHPVVARRAAIPEVVGDTGTYVEYDDPESIAEGIAKALDEGDGSRARKRIKAEFPIEKREERLVQAVMDCLGQ